MQAVAKRAADKRSLKIEQQEIESTKRTKKDACTEVSLILKLENILKKTVKSNQARN